eukprot:12412958-Karenia_brevis.AAC.1
MFNRKKDYEFGFFHAYNAVHESHDYEHPTSYMADYEAVSTMRRGIRTTMEAGVSKVNRELKAV